MMNRHMNSKVGSSFCCHRRMTREMTSSLSLCLSVSNRPRRQHDASSFLFFPQRRHRYQLKKELFASSFHTTSTTTTTRPTARTNDTKHYEKEVDNDDVTLKGMKQDINDSDKIRQVGEDENVGNGKDIHVIDYYFSNYPTLSALYQGFGQVIFVNSDLGGAIIFGSLIVGSGGLYLPSLAFLGTSISQLVGFYTTSSSLSSYVTVENHYRDGLISYNGCLIGCASAVFIPDIGTAIGTTLLGATATTYTSILLSKYLSTSSGMPQWTYAFNIIMLSALFRMEPFKVPATTATEVATKVSSGTSTSSADLVVGAAATTNATAPTTTEVIQAIADPIITTPSMLDIFIQTPLNGISQIYVVESPMTGLMILGAIASTYSPTLASYALIGSTVGSMTGYFICSASAPDIISGLYGYNSALTAMGIGVFFQHTPNVPSYVIGGAIATACFHDCMAHVFFNAFHSPCLTLPFCITMSSMYMLGLSNTIPGIALALDPHSPEKNVKQS
jgi:urea transporter